MGAINTHIGVLNSDPKWRFESFAKPLAKHAADAADAAADAAVHSGVHFAAHVPAQSGLGCMHGSDNGSDVGEVLAGDENDVRHLSPHAAPTYQPHLASAVPPPPPTKHHAVSPTACHSAIRRAGHPCRYRTFCECNPCQLYKKSLWTNAGGPEKLNSVSLSSFGPGTSVNQTLCLGHWAFFKLDARAPATLQDLVQRGG